MSLSVERFGDDGNCVVATLHRPDKRNAVDIAMLRSLRELCAMVDGCRVLVLTGSEPAFCSGADLEGVELGEFTDTLADVLERLSNLPCPTLAAIDGPALGAGLQLASACDLRMASARSPIGVPAVKLGLAVDTWTVRRLGRELGWSTARRMLLTGEPASADDLLGGFIHRLAPAGQVLAQARLWADELATLAPLSIRAHKAALDDSASPEQVERLRLAAWASEDAVEGRQAFRQRRPPRFTGR